MPRSLKGARKKKKTKNSRPKPNPLYGRRIRALRTAQALSLQDLSNKTGIRKPGLSMMETGQQEITLSHLEKILAALKVTWSEFGLDPPEATDGDGASNSNSDDGDKSAAAS